MQGELLLGACLCMFADWGFGALRFHIFVRQITPGIKFRDSLRANLATLCVSCITPFQTGGVGHLYIYTRAGVSLAGAITSGIICFLSTLVTLVFFAGGITWLNPAFLPRGTAWVSLFSFLMFGLVFVGFLLLLFKPLIPFRFFRWVCRMVQHRFTRLAPMVARAVLKVEELVTEHKAFATMFIRHHKWTCGLSVPPNLWFPWRENPRQLYSGQGTQWRCNAVGTRHCRVVVKLCCAIRPESRRKRGRRGRNRRFNGTFDSQGINPALCVTDTIFHDLLCCRCRRYCYQFTIGKGY